MGRKASNAAQEPGILPCTGIPYCHKAIRRGHSNDTYAEKQPQLDGWRRLRRGRNLHGDDCCEELAWRLAMVSNTSVVGYFRTLGD